MINKDGIHFKADVFIAPEIVRRGGETVQVRCMPHDLRSIEVFAETGWLCTAYPQDQLTRAQADAVIEQRRAAAHEMGRRKAAASRKARTRIAPLTATGAVQEDHGDWPGACSSVATRRGATRRLASCCNARACGSPEQARATSPGARIMTRHYLGLTDASVLATRHLLLTGQAISDVIESEAMGAIVGPAGLGKTFAIDHALEQHGGPVITLAFEARPTMRLVADRLLANLTGAPGRGTRFAMTDQLMNRLSQRSRLIVIGEAQNLNRDCFEYLGHLHDEPATRFGLLFDGGDGCWEVLAREPMLRSRIYRHVALSPLSDADVLALIPGYSPTPERPRPPADRRTDRRGARLHQPRDRRLLPRQADHRSVGRHASADRRRPNH